MKAAIFGNEQWRSGARKARGVSRRVPASSKPRQSVTAVSSAGRGQLHGVVDEDALS